MAVSDNLGWIGWDLDGTLAHFDEWQGVEHIGAPIPFTVAMVKAQLLHGEDVRIFTARLSNEGARGPVEGWCLKHIGRVLPITNVKDMFMKRLYDDRAYHVKHNAGQVDSLNCDCETCGGK
jgi:hypothetical protein